VAALFASVTTTGTAPFVVVGFDNAEKAALDD